MDPAVRVGFIEDALVSATFDAELRALLSTCFLKPGDEVFRLRRYWREPPQYRWFIRGADGGLIAHTAAHDKTVGVAGECLRIGGIAEVCVHPAHRGCGLVRRILATAHDWLRGRDYPFAMLFGDPRVYASSGYAAVENVVCDEPDPAGTSGRHPVKAMVRPLGARPWPTAEVYLPGPKF
jgi:GNAT superfamily N-acetyltransferase